jgi:hypothetical protein
MSGPASGTWTQLRVTISHKLVKIWSRETFKIAELFKQLRAIHIRIYKGHISNTMSKIVLKKLSGEQVKSLLPYAVWYCMLQMDDFVIVLSPTSNI